MTLCANTVCRKAGAQRCGRCKLIYYCSKECQAVDWKRHKHQCNNTTIDEQPTNNRTERAKSLDR